MRNTIQSRWASGCRGRDSPVNEHVIYLREVFHSYPQFEIGSIGLPLLVDNFRLTLHYVVQRREHGAKCHYGRMEDT